REEDASLATEEPSRHEADRHEGRGPYAVRHRDELFAPLQELEDGTQLPGLEEDVRIQKHDVNVLRLTQTHVERGSFVVSSLIDEPHLFSKRPEGGTDRDR